ncbi:MAG: MBL fold metallo-hydrolase [Anaerovoracaceae bacterium]|nr:MBL fold metallo-hydrolase [Anaerovoracaceae bacterium]
MKIKHYFTGPLQVNTYLAWDENTGKGFIVDPGGYEKQLTDDAAAANVDVKYIILTHGHGDHIGGVEEFKKDFPSAAVVACAQEAALLNDPVNNSSVEMFGRPVKVDADIYVSDKDDLKAGDLTLTFLHTPGHTPGGMCVYAAGCLFSGDTLFCRSIGRTDFYGGDFRQLINSIKDKLFYLPDDTLVLPGHMGQTTIGDEKRGNPFV